MVSNLSYETKVAKIGCKEPPRFSANEQWQAHPHDTTQQLSMHPTAAGGWHYLCFGELNEAACIIVGRFSKKATLKSSSILKWLCPTPFVCFNEDSPVASKY